MTSISAFPAILAERTDCKHYHKRKEEYVLLAAEIKRLRLQERISEKPSVAATKFSRRPLLGYWMNRMGASKD
jgi:hypothetical protein